MDSPQVPIDESAPGVLPVPLADEDLPAWWGPILDSSANDLGQLGGVVLDLDKLADVTGSDPDVLREFASTHLPTRRYLVAETLSVTVWAGVYVAIDMATKRLTVLKISRRVVDVEGLLIAMNDHPHVVKALDVFVHAGYPTTVLEWCRQGTLRTRALKSVSDWRDILRRAIEAGHGLAHLHACGLVHGDVKPTNILITHGTGKIADLGLAGPEQLHGATWGTPDFAPPEREHGVFVFAGDVYSFALTIKRSLQVHEGVPESIGHVLASGLASDYQRRPTLVQLIADLQRELDREPLELARRELVREREQACEELAREREQVRREFEKRRRWSWLQTVVVCAALVGAGGTVAIAGMCRPITNLELAEQATERGDGEAAVKNLELAMRQAKFESDHDEQARALRKVASMAESLGHDFAKAKDQVTAVRVWFLASECYEAVGDHDGQARATSLGVKHGVPSG